MITGPNQRPPANGIYGDSYERGKDPWHRDAAPEEFKDRFPHQEPVRKEGWFLVDAWGNAVAFIPDGTEFKEK